LATKQEILEGIIRPVVTGLGYECWGVALLSQGRQSLLRVYIERLVVDAPLVEIAETELVDVVGEEAVVGEEKVIGEEGEAGFTERESGIGIEDCERVSRQLSAVLDVEDPISGDYTLEVSSPGMDRPLYTLAHYQRFAGSQIAMTLRMAFEGRRKFNGLLKGVEADEVVIQVDQEEFLFPIESIEKANVVPQFD
jgi:ribosome maturation factor RimP